MGFEKGQLVLEVGHGSDCDENLRKQIAEIIGEPLIENEANEVGPIWILSPKVGRDGHVHPSDIQDAANTAGLSQTSTIAVAPNWSATKIVHRKAKK